jgi:hypothetical protein
MSPDLLDLLAAFPGAVAHPDRTMWAGVAVRQFLDGDRHAGLVAYLAALPEGLVEAITMAAPWQWAPCTACGVGKLVKPPPTPQAPRDIGDNDGPKCSFTKVRAVVGNLTTLERCPGRHYPLAGPLAHPLAAPAPELPW